MNIRFNLVIGLLFILAGALVGSSYIIQFFQVANAAPVISNQQQSNAVVAAQSAESKRADARDAYPSQLTIPSVGISIDVDPGYYDAANQTWTLSNDKAYFATVTKAPNTVSGNTYIYGHNRNNVFRPLYKTELGDEAVVTTSDSKTYTYKLVDVHDVRPTDAALLNYTGKPILTLQTCSGILDATRRLFIFNLVSAS